MKKMKKKFKHNENTRKLWREAQRRHRAKNKAEQDQHEPRT
jgi:hypothetical protein